MIITNKTKSVGIPISLLKQGDTFTMSHLDPTNANLCMVVKNIDPRQTGVAWVALDDGFCTSACPDLKVRRVKAKVEFE